MEIFSKVQKLWDEWDIRVMVLFSLLLQIMLVISGNQRKRIAGSWIRILIWLPYLLADLMANCFAWYSLQKLPGSKLFAHGILGTLPSPPPWWAGWHHCLLLTGQRVGAEALAWTSHPSWSGWLCF